MTGWRDLASCMGNPDPFFRVGHKGCDKEALDAPAKAICEACPVRAACAADDATIPIGETYGIRAGLTQDERREAKAVLLKEAWLENRRAVRRKSRAKTRNREYAARARVVLPSSRRAG